MHESYYLIESGVSGGEYSEGSLGRQNIHQVSGLDGGQECGELGVGGHKLGDVGLLSGLGDHGDHGDGVGGHTEMTMDGAVNSVMLTRGHVMRDGGLMVDRVLNWMIDLSHGPNMDDAPDLLMVTEVHCGVMRGSVTCVMSAVMCAMMMTPGAVSCDAGDEEGGCDEDPHGDAVSAGEVIIGCVLISYCCCVVNMSALYSIDNTLSAVVLLRCCC